MSRKNQMDPAFHKSKGRGDVGPEHPDDAALPQVAKGQQALSQPYAPQYPGSVVNGPQQVSAPATDTNLDA